jgi:hypothetical protein
MLAVEQEKISSCPATHLAPITMARSSLLAKSSRQSCPQLPRPKSELSTSTIGACHTLEFLGHPQPPTPIQTNNTMALGIVNNNVMKKLKAMDMKYYWLWDRISQKQLQHYSWALGIKNKCNYVTKHHAPVHHEVMRLTFLTSITTLQALCNRVSNLLPAARVC